MNTVVRERTTTIAGAALVAASVTAWAGVAGYEPSMGVLSFVAAWTLMMAAMMLPSIGPLVLLYRGPRVLLATGYLAVWSATGLLPYAAMTWGLEPELPFVFGLVGLYELSPLKSACLRRCRNAAAFLMEHYRSGPLRLGLEHGLWCIGCCVGLMTLLVVAGSMGLAWAAAIAAAVFAQKVLPFGELSARLVGIGLLAIALLIAI